MDSLDASWVEKKLLAATNTQESVQSLSMWALHHKTQHEKIVGIWFKVLKMGMYGFGKDYHIETLKDSAGT